MSVEYPTQLMPRVEFVESGLPSGLIEAGEFLDHEGIQYLAVGSSCCALNGDQMKTPNDIDVILLEDDEPRRLDNERKIDEYNRVHGFKIDDKLSRLGTTYVDDNELYIHGNGTVYRMPLPQARRIHHVATMPAKDLIIFAKTLVDGRTDDVKANRIIQTIGTKAGIDTNSLPLAHRAKHSPRDQSSRSISQFETVIK